MKSLQGVRVAFAACVTALSLVRCAALPATVPVSGAPLKADGLSRFDLLYVSDVATNAVRVYTFPGGKAARSVTGLGKPRSACADALGNVWIADVQAEDVVEYAHGGTRPIAALSTPGQPRGCAVDPKGGNVAVTSGAIVSIYHFSKHRVWRDPQQYRDPSMHAALFCNYDTDGDLFIDGVGGSKDGSFRLAELRRGGKALAGITVDARIAAPGQVQWDGEHLAVGDWTASPATIHRFSIEGKSAKEVGVTMLGGAGSVRQFWIAGATVVAPDSDGNVAVWRYPRGGRSLQTIASFDGYGAAVSVATPSFLQDR